MLIFTVLITTSSKILNVASRSSKISRKYAYILGFRYFKISINNIITGNQSDYVTRAKCLVTKNGVTFMKKIYCLWVSCHDIFFSIAVVENKDFLLYLHKFLVYLVK